jgi:Amt family ammonium transporter
VGTAIVNTIIGGCGGGLTVLFLFKFVLKGSWGNDGKWSFLLTLNGVLAGMVAQCAGCDEFQPWGALIVGMFGGVAFITVHIAMIKCRLDDPLDAVAVHGGGGKHDNSNISYIISFDIYIQLWSPNIQCVLTLLLLNRDCWRSIGTVLFSCGWL